MIYKNVPIIKIRFDSFRDQKPCEVTCYGFLMLIISLSVV